MARLCQVCAGAEFRLQADEALLAGTSFAEVATRYGWSQWSVRRHFENHVRKGMPVGENDLHVQLREAISRLTDLASTCRSTGDFRAAIDAETTKLRMIEKLLDYQHQEKARVIRETHDDGPPLELVDTYFKKLICEVEDNYDECPHCHQRTIRRWGSKPTPHFESQDVDPVQFPDRDFVNPDRDL